MIIPHPAILRKLLRCDKIDRELFPVEIVLIIKGAFMLQSFPSVRLVALDLDGTLLSRNNEVTPATREAIARAVAHGVAVVPATGRPLASLPPVVAKLPGIRYAITSNGAAVWDLGDDPMGAVYSRYANAAQRHTSEPACLLHRLMPTETAREIGRAHV